jgi:hypothetical protein
MRYFNTKVIMVIFLILSIASVSWSDSEVPPYPYVTVAEYGRYYFKMIPDTQHDREKGSGICFEVTADELDKIIWKTKGWYSFETFLSHDGKYLIRMGNWPRGNELSDDHLAVSFYKKGQLLKSYSTKDLVKNPTKIDRSVSHYFWKKDRPILNTNEYRFKIITVDNIEYIFDIVSGKIISQETIRK